jgi:hypothetical protein
MAIEMKLVVSWNKYILFLISSPIASSRPPVTSYFPHLVFPRPLSIDPSSSLIPQISVQIPHIAVSLLCDHLKNSERFHLNLS